MSNNSNLHKAKKAKNDGSGRYEVLDGQQRYRYHYRPVANAKILTRKSLDLFQIHCLVTCL